MREKVSVIVPVYNVEIMVFERCIQSILNQSYSCIEVIIVNDGSEDILTKQYQNIANKDSRVYLYNQNNLGVSAARNKGMQKAEEYFMFCDADDYLPLNCVESLMICIEKENSDLVFGNVLVEKDKSKKLVNNKKVYKKWDEIPKELLLDILDRFVGREFETIDFSFAKIYRNSIIKENHLCFSEKIKQGEDRLFNFQYLKCCRNVVYIDEVVYCYVKNEFSVTHNFFDRHVENTIFLMEKYELLIQDMDDIFRKALARRCIWSSIFLLQKYYFDKANKMSLLKKYLHFKSLLTKRIYKESVENISLKEISVFKARMEVLFIKYHLEFAEFLMRYMLGKIVS